MRHRLLSVALVVLAVPTAGWTQGRPRDLSTLSLEELASVQTTTSTRNPTELSKVPAAIFVITQEDIRRSGVTSIPEALRLAPGVQVARIDANKWAIGLRGFAKLLVDDYGAELPPDAARYLSRVREGARQMGTLVDDLLNLARLGRQELKQQVTGLSSIVEHVTTGLKREIDDASNDSRRRLLASGAIAFLTKPLDITDVLDLLDRVLGGST